MAFDLEGDAPTAARSILGSTLRLGPVAIRITEVEAYEGEDDPASHAGRGRTPRNEVMYGPPARLYVYFSYGVHWNANVICGPEGRAAGVLLRAGEVIDGVDLARSRRGPLTGSGNDKRDRDLARGPGRLCQAMAITGEHNGLDLLASNAVTLVPAAAPVGLIASGPRVGVSRAADVPWRFWIADDRYVSDYRRSPRAPSSFKGDDPLETRGATGLRPCP